MDSLTYIGHATTLLRLDQGSILTDPMLRGWLGPLRRQAEAPSPELPSIADAVLISHLHRDHFDVSSLRRIPAETPLVVPRGAERWTRKAGADRVLEVGPGDTVSVGELEVMAVPADHDGHRHRWGAEIEPLGYVIRSAESTVYFAGDTDLFPEMSELAPLDLALLPVWGWGPTLGPGHMDPERAANAAALLRPRQLREPPREFAARVRDCAPEVEVRIVMPGSAVAFVRDR